MSSSHNDDDDDDEGDDDDDNDCCGVGCGADDDPGVGSGVVVPSVTMSCPASM